jgi:hypothetical protein
MFVGATLLGAAILVGSEDRQGALIVAADELERQKELGGQSESFATPPGFADDTDRVSESRPQRPAEEIESFEFTPDEELIDDTQGFDPVPIDNGFGGNQAYPGEPQIIDQQSEIRFE